MEIPDIAAFFSGPTGLVIGRTANVADAHGATQALGVSLVIHPRNPHVPTPDPREQGADGRLRG